MHKFLTALKDYKKKNEELLDKIKNPPEGMVYLSSDPNDAKNIQNTIDFLDQSIKRYEKENEW